MRRLALLLAAALPLAACTTAVEAVRGPQLSPVGYPSALVPQTQVVLAEGYNVRQPVNVSAGANSLWRAGARAFFNDQRAKHVGDILTVQISIDDNASVQNATSRSRENEIGAGVNNLLGLESSLGRILPGGFDPANAVRFGGETSSAGSGSVNRSERVNLTIAAVVTHVLPNGNMVIQGRQEVKTNQELRELTVAGVVRPEDISSANTVRHTQIAEARISYGGRGPISRVQQVPAGQALIEQFSPF